MPDLGLPFAHRGTSPLSLAVDADFARYVEALQEREYRRGLRDGLEVAERIAETEDEDG
jgi:hypothetical protein